MRPGSVITLEEIVNGTPFFFGVWMGEPTDNPEVSGPCAAYGVVNKKSSMFMMDSIDGAYRSENYLIEFFSMEDCKPLGYQTYSSVIIEVQCEKGSWSKLNYDSSIEEAKVLLSV